MVASFGYVIAEAAFISGLHVYMLPDVTLLYPLTLILVLSTAPESETATSAAAASPSAPAAAAADSTRIRHRTKADDAEEGAIRATAAAQLEQRPELATLVRIANRGEEALAYASFVSEQCADAISTARQSQSA